MFVCQLTSNFKSLYKNVTIYFVYKMCEGSVYFKSDIINEIIHKNLIKRSTRSSSPSSSSSSSSSTKVVKLTLNDLLNAFPSNGKHISSKVFFNFSADQVEKFV